MATLSDFRDERLRKLEELKKLGINPYPASSHREVALADITSDFDNYSGKTKTVAGRIRGIRKFGKIAFIVIKDQSGELQIFLKADNFNEQISEKAKADGAFGFDQLPLLDSGDFIEVSGQVIKTQTD